MVRRLRTPGRAGPGTLNQPVGANRRLHGCSPDSRLETLWATVARYLFVTWIIDYYIADLGRLGRSA
jgi:hypothetical protein